MEIDGIKQSVADKKSSLRSEGMTVVHQHSQIGAQ